MLNQHYKYLNYIRPYRSAVRGSIFNVDQSMNMEVSNVISVESDLLNLEQLFSSSIGNIDLGVYVELVNDIQSIESEITHRELNVSVTIANEGQYIDSSVIHAALSVSSELSNSMQIVTAGLKAVASVQMDVVNASQLIESSIVDPSAITHPRWDYISTPGVTGIDTFGFNALPSGIRADLSYNLIGTLLLMHTTSLYPEYGTRMTAGLASFDKFLSWYSFFGPEGGSIRMVREYQVGDGAKIDGTIIPGAFTDYDGNSYNGTIIGNQVWSTSNLITTRYANGDSIPTGFDPTTWNSLSYGAYCIYPYEAVAGINSEQEMVDAYGVLYNTYVVSDSRGILTSSGRIPSADDFTELINYIEDNYTPTYSTGTHLKSTRTALS